MNFSIGDIVYNETLKSVGYFKDMEIDELNKSIIWIKIQWIPKPTIRRYLSSYFTIEAITRKIKEDEWKYYPKK